MPDESTPASAPALASAPEVVTTPPVPETATPTPELVPTPVSAPVPAPVSTPVPPAPASVSQTNEDVAAAQNADPASVPPTPSATPQSDPVPAPAPAPAAQTQAAVPVPTPPPASPPQFGRYSVAEASRMAVERKRSRMRRALDRVVAAVSQKGSISNDETEKLLHIPDRTASKYLSQLFKEGILKRIGIGRSIRYEKK